MWLQSCRQPLSHDRLHRYNLQHTGSRHPLTLTRLDTIGCLCITLIVAVTIFIDHNAVILCLRFSGNTGISRIIGLVYRIPLTAIIGNKGNDYYGCAFEIYNILLIISSYSLPLAVSELVSADMSLGRKKNVYRILKCALIFGLVSGTIAALILFFGAEFITGTIMKTPYSIFAVKVLVPTLIVVAVLGVMRGFFRDSER